MNKKANLLMLCGVLCLLGTIITAGSICRGAPDSSVIESAGKGEINWQNGLIRATGTGLPPANIKNKDQAKIAAKRAAKVDAYRNLAETVNGVRVTSETTVKNFAVSNTMISTKVSGFVKGAREIDIKYYSDGMVEVTLEAALNGEGGLSGIILPALAEPSISHIEVTAAEEAPAVEEAKEGPKESESEKTYTGLIINAKDLGLQPALSPKILTEEKEQVYGISSADPQYRGKIGLVGYHSNLDAAKEQTRVAQIPYIIKGVEAAGVNRSDVIIKTADARAFHNIENNEKIAEQCRVIIVLE